MVLDTMGIKADGNGQAVFTGPNHPCRSLLVHFCALLRRSLQLLSLKVVIIVGPSAEVLLQVQGVPYRLYFSS